MTDLSSLSPKKGAVKRGKRVGRGPGSGHGKTSCRGHKGQKARSGGAKPVWFEGGQMPLYRRLPKRGFYNPFRVEFQVINLDTIDKYFESGETVNKDMLIKKGLIKDLSFPVKILGRGEITKALIFDVDKVSESAKEKIEKAGGKVNVKES
ncbi:MAG: 50S ribosomal protein L15 [Candidatus Hydrothermia bacterium]|jgi:large subunit ribosomal protein L15